jgi:hypothetical protein
MVVGAPGKATISDQGDRPERCCAIVDPSRRPGCACQHSRMASRPDPRGVGVPPRGRGSRSRVLVVVASCAALVSAAAVVAVVARDGSRDPASSIDVALADRPSPRPLSRAFPGARITSPAGIGNQEGQVEPAGLLADGTVYGVVASASDRGSVAVTVDPRTGRRVVVARGDGDAEPRFLAADERSLFGVTDRPGRTTVGHGCDLPGAPCGGTPVPRPRYWRHDLVTGRTAGLAQPPGRAAPELPPPGAGRPAPGLAMAVEDDPAWPGRVVVRDLRSGRSRVVLGARGPSAVRDAVANAYGIAWDDPSASRVRLARWGGTARPLDLPAAGGTSRLTPVAAADRVFLLADRTRPAGNLVVYDPARNVLTNLGSARAWGPWTQLWAAGRYVLWNDGGPDGYRLLDLGPQPAPVFPALDDLNVTP